MNKKEIKVLECAKEIKNYCKNADCENCCFRSRENEYFCGLGGNPSLWEIPKKQILDDKEKEYLWNIIKPFKDKVDNICKMSLTRAEEYIEIVMKYTEEEIDLPCFQKDKMYIGMEPNRKYTVEELFGGK